MIFLCFGDSLTAGYPGYYPSVNGYSFGNGNAMSQYEYWLKLKCVEYLNQEHGIEQEVAEKGLEFINKGVPGDTSSGLLYRKQELLEHQPKPDYSIIIIGTNDLGWSGSIDKIISNVKTLHTLSREQDILSIGSIIPPVTRRASTRRWEINRLDFNDHIEEHFTKSDIPYTKFGYMVDEEGYLLQENTSGDGVHFSVKGYKQMGLSLFEDVVKSLIEENLEEFR